MKTFNDFIKDANSILATLDKDYEAMQSQKSDVRQDQAEESEMIHEKSGWLCIRYHDYLKTQGGLVWLH